MSFESEAELSLTIPDSELRSARNEIEQGIGDVSVNVSGGGGGPAARTVRADDERRNTKRRETRKFRWARQRTGFMEETVELLMSIDDSLEDGGGIAGGGGGGGGILSNLGAFGAGRLGLGAGGLAGATVGTLSLGTVGAIAVTGGVSLVAGKLTFDKVTEEIVDPNEMFDLVSGEMGLGEIFGEDKTDGVTGDTSFTGGSQTSTGETRSGEAGVINEFPDLPPRSLIDRLERTFNINIYPDTTLNVEPWADTDEIVDELSKEQERLRNEIQDELEQYVTEDQITSSLGSNAPGGNPFTTS